ncbi:MAG: hypothetical protein PHX68_02055 [Alphaproteobacteria bacterium]|nr:hypothetical protein [Alphaproteobacteria bacterium]
MKKLPLIAAGSVLGIFLGAHVGWGQAGCAPTGPFLCAPAPVIDIGAGIINTFIVGTKAAAIAETEKQKDLTDKIVDRMAGNAGGTIPGPVAKVDVPQTAGTGLTTPETKGIAGKSTKDEGILAEKQKFAVGTEGVLGGVGADGQVEAGRQTFDAQRKYVDQEAVVDFLARTWVLKTLLASDGETGSIKTTVETLEKQQAAAQNKNDGLKLNATNRLAYNELLTLKQKLAALRLKAQSELAMSRIQTRGEPLNVEDIAPEGTATEN